MCIDEIKRNIEVIRENEKLLEEWEKFKEHRQYVAEQAAKVADRKTSKDRLGRLADAEAALKESQKKWRRDRAEMKRLTTT